MLKKFTSRKFIISLITTICGFLGMMNVADDTIGFISSILMIVVPNVIYIVTEGSIDKESVKNMLGDIADLLGNNDKATDDKILPNVNDKET